MDGGSAGGAAVGGLAVEGGSAGGATVGGLPVDRSGAGGVTVGSTGSSGRETKEQASSAQASSIAIISRVLMAALLNFRCLAEHYFAE